MDCKFFDIKKEPELIIEDNFNITTVEQQPQLQQPIKCNICDKGFRQEDFEIHLTTHNFTVEGEQKPKAVKKEPKLQLVKQAIICRICKKGFRKADLLIHLTTHKVSTEDSTPCLSEIVRRRSELKKTRKERQLVKIRLRKINELRIKYKKKFDVNLLKTNLLCVVCKDTLFETKVDDKLHCLSCVSQSNPETK